MAEFAWLSFIAVAAEVANHTSVLRDTGVVEAFTSGVPNTTVFTNGGVPPAVSPQWQDAPFSVGHLILGDC